MPDRDVFDQWVGRGWRSAARRLLLTDDPDAIAGVLRALASEFKAEGSRGLDQVVDILLDFVLAGASTEERRRAHDRMDQVRLKQGSDQAEMFVEAGKRLLADPTTLYLDDRDGRQPRISRIRIARFLLAEFADARLCPAELMPEIIEQGHVSFQALRDRREQAKLELRNAPEVHALAIQLLADPQGGLIVVPRRARSKKSQAEILVSALTP